MAKPKTALTPRDTARLLWRIGWAALLLYAAFRIDIFAVIAALSLPTAFLARRLAKPHLKKLHLTLERSSPRGRCGETAPLSLTLKNNNRFLPIVRPTIDLRLDGDARIHKVQYKGQIKAGASVTLPVSIPLNTRGEHRILATAAHAYFPFGLYHTKSTFYLATEPLIVWPRLSPTPVQSVLRYRPTRKDLQHGHRSKHHDALDASVIRDYQNGDPKRSINWRLTAKSESPVVIESRANHAQRFELFLSSSRQLWTTDYAFEQMLSQLSFIVPELLKQGRLIGIRIDDTDYPIQQTASLIPFQDALARLKSTQEPPPIPEELPSQRFLHVLPHQPNGLIIGPAPKRSFAHAR